MWTGMVMCCTSSLILGVMLACVGAQEVHLSLLEEIVLDVAECGAVDCAESDSMVLLLCPPGSEQQRMGEHTVCASSSFQVIPTASADDFPSSQENRRDLAPTNENLQDDLSTPLLSLPVSSALDISVLITLNLSLDEGVYNMTALGETLLATLPTNIQEAHITFQEYLTLDVQDASLGASCEEARRGFQTESMTGEGGLPMTLTEFTACPVRIAFEDIMQEYTALSGAAIPTAAWQTFASFLSAPQVCGAEGGYQHVLIAQEFLACVPCFPNTYCPKPDETQSKLHIMPLFVYSHTCPNGTYNPLDGQHDKNECQALQQGDTQSESHKALLLRLSESVLLPMLPDSQAAVHLDFFQLLLEQETLKQRLFQWVSNHLQINDSNRTDPSSPSQVEIHVVKWGKV